MDGAKILVIDDEPEILTNCELLLTEEGYRCWTLSDPKNFRALLSEVRPDVVLTDVRMPGVDGMTLLTLAGADDPALPVIIMTAYGNVSSAVEAIHEGAFDYLTKPFKTDQLLVVIERAVNHREILRENQLLREEVVRHTQMQKLIGSSPVMQKLFERVAKVAPTDANVLVLGESGTGKEMIARRIHALSPRGERPFVPVDCAALPDGLLENELFGHERGAFTGADRQKRGLMEVADGGTVFLDEISELGRGLQAKLLRALEERTVRRLGGDELVGIDIRIVAATNVDLETLVAEGKFREDLFFRLNVIPIRVPPLREREGDVVVLARHFVAQSSGSLGTDPPKVSPAVWTALERYGWPGNVRELRNLMERVVVLNDSGKVTLSDLPNVLRPGMTVGEQASFDPGATSYEDARAEAMREFKARYLQGLLEANQGNISKAARSAGLSRRTLHKWLAELSGAADGNR
jgi:DNA-binding NtrC family response regulator